MNTHHDSGRLPYLGVLRFSGPDAVEFLQGQVSNDTRRLKQARGLLAAYSSPQGRVVALFHCLPHSSGILAVLPREIVLPTLERLRKFVMRAKVQIQDVSDTFVVAGCFGEVDTPTAGASYVETDGIGSCAVSSTEGVPSGASHGVADSRYWVVGPVETLTEDQSSAAGDFERRWRMADVRVGRPQVYAATREMFVAQMLNLDLIDGISFTKGCFTGQEIIARTQHLGRIKRRLHRLALPAGSWALGQAVNLTDGRTGRLTEVVNTGEGVEALAVLSEARNEATEEAPEAPREDDAALVPAIELPLPYPLTQAR